MLWNLKIKSLLESGTVYLNIYIMFVWNGDKFNWNVKSFHSCTIYSENYPQTGKQRKDIWLIRQISSTNQFNISCLIFCLTLNHICVPVLLNTIKHTILIIHYLHCVFWTRHQQKKTHTQNKLESNWFFFYNFCYKYIGTFVPLYYKYIYVDCKCIQIWVVYWGCWINLHIKISTEKKIIYYVDTTRGI